jgi:hypothetical protein
MGQDPDVKSGLRNNSGEKVFVRTSGSARNACIASL